MRLGPFPLDGSGNQIDWRHFTLLTSTSVHFIIQSFDLTNTLKSFISTNNVL